MTAGAIRVGPFALGDEISRGATAVVWAGRHEPTGAPVAIKVISPPSKTKIPLHRLFAREVRALASLTHPGIVTIHDHGRVGSDASAASGGALPRGAPYLVMERATHGTLRAMIRGSAAPDYLAARGVLLSVLDALAHAHARHVVHRDVKPANILTTRVDGELVIKLTDFGIAHALTDATGWRPQMVGTPAYMAPEQVRAEPRRQGPWTDLYAVGCLAYRLATGSSPFAGRGDVASILGAHLADPPPRLEPVFEVPAGFEEWIGRLLEKSPGARYRRCADAAVDLLDLGDATASGETWEDRTLERVSYPQMFTIAAETHTSETDILTALPLSATASVSALRPPAPRPPASWRPQRAVDRPPMASVGLGLYGVRTVPVIGREAERDVLWERMREAFRERRPSLVALTGPAGTGKSRLAAWLTERAHEVGAATVLRATHGVTADPSHGWIPMLARELRATGLTGRAELRARLEDHLDGLPSAAGGELLDAVAGIFQSSEAQSSGIDDDARPLSRRLLGMLAEERPLVVWLDDAQWGLDSLVFVQDVLTRGDGLPIFFVATVRSDLTGGGRTEESLLSALLELPRSSRIEIPPLRPRQHIELVRWLLGLDQELAERVSERTQGHPLFAVQLVGDLIARGVLEPGPSGFRLREGERLTLPDDIHDVWRQSVDRLVARHGEDARGALEVAAALGADIDYAEWEAACLDLGLTLPPRLLDAMLDTRLALATPLGWTFAHGTLRESLERLARPSGRWVAAHLACARAISRIHPDRSPHAERIALHCIAAGRFESAVKPLLEAVESRMRLSHLDVALDLLSKLEATLDALRVDEADPDRLAATFLRAQIARARSEVDVASRLLGELERLQGPTPRVLLERSGLEWLERSNRQAAQRFAAQAVEGFCERGDPSGEAEARLRLAGILVDRGQVDVAVIGHVSRAREIYESLGDHSGLAACEKLLGQVALVRRDFARASAHSQAAAEIFRRAGELENVAFSLMLLGEVERYRRALDVAATHYEHAERIFAQLGSVRIVIAQLNRALVDIHLERFEDAERRLVAIEAGKLPHPARMRANLAYAWLPLDAASERWARFDQHLEEAARWTPEQGRTSMDFALLAHQAAQVAARRRDPSRAATALSLAERHYRGLGMNREAESMRAAIGKLQRG